MIADGRYVFFISIVGQHQMQSFFVGGRFLSQCEVSFLQETRIVTLNPSENLNDLTYVLGQPV